MVPPINDSNASYGFDQVASADILNYSGVTGNIVVGTSAIEAKVGSTRLENRKVLVIYNSSNSTIYWGFSPSLTTTSGLPIFKQQTLTIQIGDALAIYLIANTSGNNILIAEGG
ncbi:MAG: hypothetical protein ABIM30_01205 [candidate division WOR-3 bacterium]